MKIRQLGTAFLVLAVLCAFTLLMSGVLSIWIEDPNRIIEKIMLSSELIGLSSLLVGVVIKENT